jgi:hypothetical protein
MGDEMTFLMPPYLDADHRKAAHIVSHCEHHIGVAAAASQPEDD